MIQPVLRFVRCLTVLLAAFAASLAACAPTQNEPAATPAANAAPAPADSAVAATTAPPGTDIFLVPISAAEGVIRLDGAPMNVTRRTGYDNQPGWLPSGDALLFTSVRAGDQADIFRYDLASGRTTQVTATPESEYSPTPMPDGRGISVIRVEADSTQRLWRFDWNGADPNLILENVAPVGYHAWADSNTLALFVLGEPPTLQLANPRTGTAETVATNIGRSLHRVPGRNAISFVDKTVEGEWWIRELDLATRAVRPLVRTLPDAEDYAWTPGGTLLMAQGSSLYQWMPGRSDWRLVGDLGNTGLRTITRIAISPGGDRLALVAEDR